jgi:hypothetical protein
MALYKESRLYVNKKAKLSTNAAASQTIIILFKNLGEKVRCVFKSPDLCCPPLVVLFANQGLADGAGRVAAPYSLSRFFIGKQRWD